MAAGQCDAAVGTLLGIVDRIVRLTHHEQVIGALLPRDIEQLQHRAGEAMAALSKAEHVVGGESLIEATPTLCALAVQCLGIVERAELSTGNARLVSAGCEVLAALLVLRPGSVQESGHGFDWARDTLEELSDQLDFLALEVYCGLGRLETAVNESDDLPVVLDPALDDFGSYWGSLEHRQALQELSAWLLCVVFRALGYGAVTAQRLIEFTNQDCLLLCALLRGLFASCGGNGLPADEDELQGVGLAALCGLTSPDLVFHEEVDVNGDGGSIGIEEKNRLLGIHLEVLCAAVVETGLLPAVLDVAVFLSGAPLSSTTAGAAHGAAHGARLLAFLAALTLEAGALDVGLEDATSPALRLRTELYKRADRLGSLLETIVGTACEDKAMLKELTTSCAILTAAFAAFEKSDGYEDGFTLACRMLLQTCLSKGVGTGADASTLSAALVALAANVDDLEISRAQLRELIGALSADDQRRGRGRLTRRDRLRIPVRGGAACVLDFFGPMEAVEAETSTGDNVKMVSAAPTEVKSSGSPVPVAGLRDIVQNAPQELRCRLDGKLLCDPVLSPGGIVFERTTLARWLQTHGPICPMTGDALELGQCERMPEVRKKVTEWVRGEGRQRAVKKKKDKP